MDDSLTLAEVMFRGVVIAFAASPLAMLAIAIKNLFRQGQQSRGLRFHLPLVITILSYLFFWTAVAVPEVIGDSYSDRRFDTVHSMLVVTAVATLLAYRQRMEGQQAVIAACVLTWFVWAFVWLVSNAPP